MRRDIRREKDSLKEESKRRSNDNLALASSSYLAINCNLSFFLPLPLIMTVKSRSLHFHSVD